MQYVTLKQSIILLCVMRQSFESNVYIFLKTKDQPICEGKFKFVCYINFDNQLNKKIIVY